MFVARNGGVIYGAWSVRQWADQEELADDHPDVVAFNAPRPPIDQSDLDLFDKKLKAVCLYFAQVTGKTPAQVRAGVKAAFDSLP